MAKRRQRRNHECISHKDARCWWPQLKEEANAELTQCNALSPSSPNFALRVSAMQSGLPLNPNVVQANRDGFGVVVTVAAATVVLVCAGLILLLIACTHSSQSPLFLNVACQGSGKRGTTKKKRGCEYCIRIGDERWGARRCQHHPSASDVLLLPSNRVATS